MATQLQIRRGTNTQNGAFTGAEGELSANTTNDSVHVHDGSTAGGFELARADFGNISTSATLTIATLNTTNLDLTNLEVTNLKAKDGTAAGSIADSTGVVTIASAVLTTADINGGSIDGAVIGGSTAAAGTFTTLTTGAITSSAGATITVSDNSDTLTLVSTDADANTGPVLNLFRNSASPADNDAIGKIVFKGDDDGGNAATFALIQATATDVSNGSENAKLEFTVAVNDAFSPSLTLEDTGAATFSGSVTSQAIIATNASGTPSTVNGADNNNTLQVFAGTTANQSFGLIVDAGTSSSDYAAEFRKADNTTIMRLRGDGNVGIGEAAPARRVVVKAENTETSSIQFQQPTTGNASGDGVGVGMDASQQGFFWNYESNAIYFGGTTSGEAMRISGGNVLIGKTTDVFGTAGIALRGTVADFTRNGGTPININRLTNDGSLIALHKDGTAVGSVGVANGDLNIDGDTGIRFQSSSLMPRSGGSDADATVDLGLSSHRWKDAYITGLDVTASTYNKINSYFSGSYISGFKFSDLNGGIWYDAGTDDLTVSAGHANSQLILVSGGSEAGRFDASRNFLVGTSNTGANHASDGAYITPDGQLIARATGIVSYLNRRGSDGQIIQFMDDGTGIGAISANSGDLAIHSTTASHVGLVFGNTRIEPSNNSGVTVDNTVDLGNTDRRYKDLYTMTVKASTGTPAAPAYSFAADTNSGMYLLSADNLGFSVGGVQKIFLSASQFNMTGNGVFSGSISKGSGSFKIDHPLPAKTDTHHLVHSFVEAPQADNIYRGSVDLVGGSATVNIDAAAGMTDGTFVLLNTNVQCFTSNESGWTAIKGSVSGNTLTITAQDSDCTDTISWMVVGERHDQHMKETEWTDSDGKVIVEPLKQETED